MPTLDRDSHPKLPIVIHDWMLSQGGDLRQAITRDETAHYSWCGTGREVALDIARGLHFLHSSGVVHRSVSFPSSFVPNFAQSIS